MVHYSDRMKQFGQVAVLLLFVQTSVESSLLDPVIENVRHIKATRPPDNVSGIWRKKMLWKPRWIKEWKSSNVLKPVWKKFWGPVIIREWVPIPKPPPHWDSHSGSNPNDSTFSTPSQSFLNVGQPPEPNFSYLSKSPSSSSFGGHSGGYTSIPPESLPSQGYVYKPPKKPFPTYSSPSQSPSLINFHSARLPIATPQNSPAETYKGQSSYGTNVDSTAFDLNPPVEKYNPNQPGYDYKPPSSAHLTFGGSPQTGHHQASHSPFFFKPHLHYTHHHHQHHHPSQPSHAHTHSHTSDLSKFPPDWNSWKPSNSHSHPHSLVQQASSAVSVVSSVRSTTTAPVHSQVIQQTVAQGFKPVSDDFIQPAHLVSEYHYSESGTSSPTTLKPVLGSSSLAPPHKEITYSPPHLLRQPVTLPSQPPTPVPDTPPLPPRQPPTHPSDKPLLPSPSNSQVSLVHNHASISVVTPRKPQPAPQSKPNKDSARVATHRPSSLNPAPQKPGTKQTKPHFPKNHVITLNKVEQAKTAPQIKVPDFKALPADTVETFHFVDAFPSNESLTRAALVSKPNASIQSPRLNQVEIVTSKTYKKAPSYVANLAKAIVQEHMKNLQRANEQEHRSMEHATGMPTATTERTANTVVISTTSSSIRKTLKAYLADEANPNKVTGVYVVTPTPQSSS